VLLSRGRYAHCNTDLGIYVTAVISLLIATRYGQDGLEIEFRWRRDFPRPGAHSVPYTVGTGERCVVLTTHPHLYSSCGPLWPFVGRALPYLYFCASVTS
jgi:hypothetical protein